jgi:hypothetical protein
LISEQITNGLYYSFSTIAQTLATIVGLIGAFAIFKISRLNEIVDDCTGYVCDKTGNLELVKAVHEARLKDVIKLWKDFTVDPPGPGKQDYNKLVFKLDLLKRTAPVISKIKKWLLISMTLCCTSIVISLFILAYAHSIKCDSFGNYLFFVGIIGTITSIAGCGRLIFYCI